MAEAQVEVQVEAQAEEDEIGSHATSLRTFQVPMPEEPGLLQGGPGRRPFITVVHALWNGYYVQPMLQDCREALEKGGIEYELLAVPGATEIVAATRGVLRRSPSAVICFAVLIRGESDSYTKTCHGVANALMKLNASQDVPIINGLLMCQDEAQAEKRTHGNANPGKAWAETALYMAQVSSNVVPEDEPHARVAGA